jgi:NCAIR mutase (PurE)-related protein
MNETRLRELLEKVKSGEIPVDSAVDKMAHLPYTDIGCAKVDNHRALRCGFPEVIFCERKRPQEVLDIMKHLSENGDDVLATRLSLEQEELVRATFPQARINSAARTAVIKNSPVKTPEGCIYILSGGTSDQPVAEEARETAEIMGNAVHTVYDAGVAGIHRLLKHHEELRRARVVVAVAGMEGALPGVVAGLLQCPVIAVPTSVGYGASFGGLSALLTMLNSCAAGVAVVNIDNGFGAGYIASLINKRK